jgi:hypothetical protein
VVVDPKKKEKEKIPTPIRREKIKMPRRTP